MMQQMKAKTLNSVESFSNRKITVFSNPKGTDIL